MAKCNQLTPLPFKGLKSSHRQSFRNSRSALVAIQVILTSQSYYKMRTYSACFFFKKILSTNSCLHTLLPPKRNNEVLSKLRNREFLKYPVPYSSLKNQKISALPQLPPGPLPKTANELVCFILHFMLWTVYRVMCILCRVFCSVFYIVLYAYTVQRRDLYSAARPSRRNGLFTIWCVSVNCVVSQWREK